MSTQVCILCKSKAELFFGDEKSKLDYFLCAECDLRFLDPKLRLSRELEKAQYLAHNNDFSDPRYHQFVEPLSDLVQKSVATGSRGLDFGSGSTPILTRVLRRFGYKVSMYDYFFHKDESVWNEKFDFVVACEVVEHLFDPQLEFQRLCRVLNRNAPLGIMTLLFQPGCNFGSWYYRLDPTHVCFYSSKTFKWIQMHFGFSKLEIESDRLIILTR